MLSRLPLNGLRCFEAAARHMSFKLAAGELFVTPAAISQQIKALETELASRSGSEGSLFPLAVSGQRPEGT